MAYAGKIAGPPGISRQGLREELHLRLPPARVLRTGLPRLPPTVIPSRSNPTHQRRNQGPYHGLNKTQSVLLERPLFLRRDDDLLRADQPLLLADLLQDYPGGVVDVGLQAVLLDLLDGQRREEGILLDDLPGIQVQLRVDGSLRLVQDVEAEVVRLYRRGGTSSMGR